MITSYYMITLLYASVHSDLQKCFKKRATKLQVIIQLKNAKCSAINTAGLDC